MTHIVRTAIRCNSCEYISEDPREFTAYVIVRGTERKLDLCAKCDKAFATWWDCGDATKKKTQPAKPTDPVATVTCIKCGFVAQNRRGASHHHRYCNPSLRKVVNGKPVCVVCNGYYGQDWHGLLAHTRDKHRDLHLKRSA